MGVERLGRRSRAGEVTDPANLDGVIGDASSGLLFRVVSAEITSSPAPWLDPPGAYS
ncbi:hypothetical protein CM1200mP19_0390 [bacterium]|nr:MAG: hypothetical protein CM1200mP19_0390 [bacterium]